MPDFACTVEATELYIDLSYGSIFAANRGVVILHFSDWEQGKVLSFG